MPEAQQFTPATNLDDVYKTLSLRPLTTKEELQAFYRDEMNEVRGGDKIAGMTRGLNRAYGGVFYKTFFMGHPDIAISLSNLAGLYQRLGRYAEAEPLYLEALGILRNALPSGHLYIAQSLNNLAELYRRQGHYDEAEPLYQEVLPLVRVLTASGPQHPNWQIIGNNARKYMMERGKQEEAEAIAKELGHTFQ